MKLHEHQAKALMKQYHIAVPVGSVVHSVAEAVAACGMLGGDRWLVKAQIHAGGRGKAGGVIVAESPVEVAEFAGQLLGRPLVTKQTGPEGLMVDTLLIEVPVTIAKELYLSLSVDRSSDGILLIASAAGGLDIEEVAAMSPEKVRVMRVDPLYGISDFHTRSLGFCLGLPRSQFAELGGLLKNLFNLLQKSDASLVEINPLTVLESGTLVALDAKIVIDDNALFRQPQLAALRDLAQESAIENQARSHGVSYIALDGNIGCIVNGAGLAMATMDLVKHYGGEPANFLDVGGGSGITQIRESFRIMLAEPGIKAILVNIFGGMVRCDLVAEGILQALDELALDMPLVVRLEGTNAPEGRRMLAASRFQIEATDALDEAVKKAVEFATSESAWETLS